MPRKSIPMDYTEEETIARREAMLKRMLSTPPQHRTAKGEKANPPKQNPPEKQLRPTKAKLLPEEYSIGFSEILSDVTEPMKLLMRENSRALDEVVTSRFRGSRSPKPMPD